MKKAITILLTAALMLSMAACGGGSGNTDTSSVTPSSTPVEEESTEILAEELDLRTAMEQRDDNEVKAANLYVGNTYIVTGIVSKVYSTGYCTLKPTDGAFVMGFFKVYLPQDELSEISKDDVISVVGKIASTDHGAIEMNPASLVTGEATLITISKEETIEIAERIGLTTIYNEIKDNRLRAEEMYMGNIYRIHGTVALIDKESICFVISGGGQFNIYLSSEDLLKLSTGDSIEVVGEITYISSIGMTMRNAYLVE